MIQSDSTFFCQPTRAEKPLASTRYCGLFKTAELSHLRLSLLSVFETIQKDWPSEVILQFVIFA